jgi:hypothetical protein
VFVVNGKHQIEEQENEVVEEGKHKYNLMEKRIFEDYRRYDEHQIRDSQTDYLSLIVLEHQCL